MPETSKRTAHGKCTLQGYPFPYLLGTACHLGSSITLHFLKTPKNI